MVKKDLDITCQIGFGDWTLIDHGPDLGKNLEHSNYSLLQIESIFV